MDMQVHRNLSENHADVALLLEDRDAEAGLIAEGEAEVGSADLLEILAGSVPA